ncbi:MAG: hypothetical protein JKY10_10135 [Cohaesibacteraceae bacterium]|nr:hypothetical protein [Cohaesibacteraceae bacterium]
MFAKPIRWEKFGLFLKPKTDKWWSLTHAMIPTPEVLGDGLFRVYYSGRNDNNQSQIAWADVDLNEPFRVVRYSNGPVLQSGDLGCFDDNGVTPSCVIDLENGEKALYYIGWNPGSTVRMHLFGGLAISKDGGESFRRYSRAPIIERCITDPFLNTAPWVVKSGDDYRMYYVSGCAWLHKDLPRYNIKMARSHDGKTWHRDGHVCIDFKNSSENALARPYVIFEDDIWKMWFAHKGATYRLSYAESEDGINWVRRDDLCGIDVSNTGFDSEMIEYAAVVSHEERHFMFYNGNNYGYDGIGLAVEA